MKIDLKSIKSPADIRNYDMDGLELLCASLRAPLIRKLGAHGGHVGPNLGVVEATVALHYVFNTPADRIVFDVSHQTYVHKMLTGRIEAFLDPDHYSDVTGYTNPRESDYDLFEVGHTSTSIALAVGLAKARDLEGGSENVVAFIGDASLGGGEALEALEYAPELHSNFIVILNDNQMSIAENHGALFSHLTELRQSNGTAANNIFKALGYEYIYVREGNNIRALVRAFEEARNAGHAVLIHINTMKGEGLPVAEQNKEEFHYSMPFDLKTGGLLSPSAAESYIEMFARHMSLRMQENSRLVTVNAGTPGAIGFTADRRKAAGRQFVDTGICERDGHIHPAFLRPAVAGHSHKQSSRSSRRLQRWHMGHTRHDAPRILRYFHGVKYPQLRIYCPGNSRRIYRSPRLGNRPDRPPGIRPHTGRTGCAQRPRCEHRLLPI